MRSFPRVPTKLYYGSIINKTVDAVVSYTVVN